MHNRIGLTLLAAGFTTLAALTTAHAQPSVSTVTYQGVLTQNGTPVADGAYTLTFKIYDAAAAGNIVETIPVSGVQTTQGRFAALVPVTPSTFNGSDRWWSVTFNSTELPRQKVTAVPYAVGYGGTSLGIAISAPSERLEVRDGNILLSRFTEFPTDDRYVRFTTQATSGGSVQHWGAGVTPVSGRYNVDQNICDFWIGNGVDSLSLERLIVVNKDGEPEMRRREEYPTGDRAIKFSTKATTGGSTQYWAAGVTPIAGRFNVDENICDFFIGKRVNSGPWEKILIIDKNGVVSVPVLTIRGADLAERFTVAAGVQPRDASASVCEGVALNVETEPLPGMVVSIDPAHPGKLMVATTAYDRKVAGVISGANGLDAGVILGKDNKNPLIDGEHPVAMTGRVWVYADDSSGRIEPGDRLTTSDVKPGYAMKVFDESKAPGAVIGKAMTPRDEKTGMVLVLVNLQ